MQFNSIDFMFFFPVVVMIYFFVPKKIRDIWLLIASYFFYMSWNPVYALLIGFSTIVTFLCGIGIENYESIKILKLENRTKVIFILGVSINIFILGIFKYGNFILESIDSMLRLFHVGTIGRRLNWLLPVGISFYTFQALGYIIDVYGKKVNAEKNFIKYALFVSFFPQLIAGPIERTSNLLRQMNKIEEINLWNAKRISSGLILMIWGLFMKMVIADRISILVDTVFNNYRMYGSIELIMATIGFSLQIYCDFGSYSSIAIGAAKVLGFELVENFNTPYFALNIKDFWNRWHISLSTWLKDYIYIPLGGGNKKSKKRINFMIVFIISGLWHGAGWNFITWGVIHGFYRIMGDILFPVRLKIQEKLNVKTDCFSYRLLQVILTFSMVSYAWIFFRADTMMDALRFIKRILMKPTPWLLFNGGIYNLGLDRVEMNILLFALILLFWVDYVRFIKMQTIDEFLISQNIWFEWATIIILIIMLFVFGKYGPSFDAQQFIYFQF